jgi:hypothetical protein
MTKQKGDAHSVNSVTEALRTLFSGQSGHWGIAIERGVMRTSCDLILSELNENLRGLVRCFRCDHNSVIQNVASGQIFQIAELPQLLDSVVRDADQSKPNDVLRWIFSDFHLLSVDEQCGVLRITRGLREEQTDLRIQTVVIGTWNFFRLQEHWKKNYRDASPVPDRKHVFFKGGCETGDIQSKLHMSELISSRPSNFEDTCVEMLLEATGGDEFLIDYIVDCLSSQRQRLDHVESAIAQTIDSAHVAEEFQKRCKRLTGEGWRLLRLILNQQFFNVAENSSDAEDLRLEGIVESRRTGGLNVCLSLRSVIVDTILRAKWRVWASDQPPVYEGRDLARPNTALNTAAYRLISKIETTLRNVVILSLGANSAWTERIVNVKTGAYSAEGAESEFTGLVRQLQNALAPYLGDMTLNTASEAERFPEGVDSNNAKRSKQITLIQAAENWRERNHDNTMLDLAGNSLIYFITTEGLVNILRNREIYSSAIKPFFPEKAELGTFLEHYVAIRGAVAHNQPITLDTLSRLEDMRESLEKRLYLAKTSVDG